MSMGYASSVDGTAGLTLGLAFDYVRDSIRRQQSSTPGINHNCKFVQILLHQSVLCQATQSILNVFKSAFHLIKSRINRFLHDV